MRRILRWTGWPAPEGPADEAAFRDDQHVHGARHVQLLLAAVVLVCIAWYPTDLWFFANHPAAREAFVTMRRDVVFVALTTLALTTFVAAFRTHTVRIGVVAGAVTCFVATRAMGLAGGPDEPWFHFTYMLVLMPLIVALPPLGRVVTTIGYAAAMVAGYFVANAWSLRTPHALAGLSFLCFAVLLSVGSGLVADGLRRRVFFSRLQAERQARALSELSASLELQVQKRTAELRRTLDGLEAAREEERTRIARDLHDELGQELTGLGYAVDLAVIRERLGDPLGANLGEIRGQLARLRETTRAILSGLRPKALDDLGLAAAAEWLVSRVRTRSALEVRLQLEPAEPQLPPSIAVAVFRVLQEALSNAVRHSGAGRVDVELRCGPDRLELTVRDDGTGFDPAGASDGFGLLGMRERARALGGTLDVQTGAGAGTTVRLGLPLEARTREKAA